jgi:hypothetical protein
VSSHFSSKLSELIKAGSDRLKYPVLIIGVSLVLTGFTVYDQIFHRVGLAFMQDEQLRFHTEVISGNSTDPWQYRILAPYIIESVHGWIRSLGLELSYTRIFIDLRLFQNFLIFVSCWFYFRAQGISRSKILVALAILAWGFTYSGYSSHLAFDTYFDILFYILAGYLVITNRSPWIILLSVLAALNRETGILIPLLPVVATLTTRPRISTNRRDLIISGLGLLAFLVVIFAVRASYGPKPLDHRYLPGLNLLKTNLSEFYTYFSFIATFAVIPLVAILHWRGWPSRLKRWFWLCVPVWLVVHAFASHLAEARLLLAPYVLIILPAAMMGIDTDT